VWNTIFMSPFHFHGIVLRHRGNVTFILRVALQSTQTANHWVTSINAKHSTSCLLRLFIWNKSPKINLSLTTGMKCKLSHLQKYLDNYWVQLFTCSVVCSGKCGTLIKCVLMCKTICWELLYFRCAIKPVTSVLQGTPKQIWKGKSNFSKLWSS